jgi:hypothetical protein
MIVDGRDNAGEGSRLERTDTHTHPTISKHFPVNPQVIPPVVARGRRARRAAA